MSLLMIIFLINSTGLSEVKPLGDSDSLEVKTTSATTSEGENELEYTWGMDTYSVGFNKHSISTNTPEEQVNIASGTLELKIKLLSLPIRGGEDYDLYLTYKGSPLSLPEIDFDNDGDQNGRPYGFPSVVEPLEPNGNIVSSDMGNCGLGWNIMPGEASISHPSRLSCYDSETAIRRGFINISDNYYSLTEFRSEPDDGSWHVIGKPDCLFGYSSYYPVLNTPGWTYTFNVGPLDYPEVGSHPQYGRNLFLLNKIEDRNGNLVEVEWSPELNEGEGRDPRYNWDTPPARRIPAKICTPTDTCYIFRKCIIPYIPPDADIPELPGNYCAWQFYVVDSVMKRVNGEQFTVKFYYHQEWLEDVMEFWYGHASVLLDSIDFLKNGQKIKPSYKFEYSSGSTGGELTKFTRPDGAEYHYLFENVSYAYERMDSMQDPLGYTKTQYRRISQKTIYFPGEGGTIGTYHYLYGPGSPYSLSENSVGAKCTGLAACGPCNWYWPGEYPTPTYYSIYRNCTVVYPDNESIKYFFVDSAYIDKYLEVSDRPSVFEWAFDKNNYLVLYPSIILPVEKEAFYGKPYKIVKSTGSEITELEQLYWGLGDDVAPEVLSRKPLHPVLKYKFVQNNPNNASLESGEKAKLYKFEDYDKYDNILEHKFLGEVTYQGESSSETFEFGSGIYEQEWKNENLPNYNDTTNSDNWEVSISYLYQGNNAYENNSLCLYGLADSTLKYDGSGNLVKKIKYEYDDPSSLVDISPNPIFHNPDCDVNKTIRGNMTKKTEWINMDGTRSEEYCYDICGNLVKMKDYMGHDYEFDYGPAYVFPDTLEYPDGSIEDFDFDKKGNLVKVTDKNNVSRYFEYDCYGRLTLDSISGGDLLNKYQYYDFERYARTWSYYNNFDADVTYYYYDELARLNRSKRTSYSGKEIIKEYFYDPNGRMNKETVLRFNDAVVADTVKKKFDVLNRVTEIEYPSDSDDEIVEYFYDGDTTEVYDELGYQTTLINDASGNLIEVIDALGNYTDYYYDVNGNLDSIIDAEEKKTEFEYDWLGNLVRREGPDRGKNTFEYYPNGNIKLTVQNSGDSILYEYDELGRIVKKGRSLEETLVEGQTTELYYDNTAHWIKGQSGYNTYYWNELNKDLSDYGKIRVEYELMCDTILDLTYVVPCSLLLVSYTPTEEIRVGISNYPLIIIEGDPAWNSWKSFSNTIDKPFDNLVGMIFKHTCECLNHPEYDPTWSDGIKGLRITGIKMETEYEVSNVLESYYYDNYDDIGGVVYNPPSGLHYSEGRLTGFENASVREVYFYDKFGNLCEKLVIPLTVSVGEKNFKYSYDLKGRIIKLQYEDDYKVEYSYDNFDNISSVIINNDKTVTLSSTAAGLLSGVQFPGWVTDTFTYQPRNWMEEMEVKDISNPYQREFEYNNRGELLKELDPSINPTATTSEYIYDSLGRLTDEYRGIYEDGVLQQEIVHDFTYDAVGNRDEVDSNTYTYHYSGTNKTNKLKNDGFHTYEYNDIGCISSKTDVNGTVDFSYDSEGKLTDLEISGDGTNHYKYYYKGYQRIRQEELGGGGTIVEGFIYSCEVKSQDLSGGKLEAVFLNENNNELGTQFLQNIPDTDENWITLSGNIPEDEFPSGTFKIKLRVRRESGSTGSLWVGDMNVDIEEGQADQSYNYFYDNAGNLIMVEDDDPSTPPTRYIYAGKRLLATENDGSLYFYHLDRIGSPIMITDEDGEVVKEKKYEAFGNLKWSDGPYDDNREFTSKEKDPTGFHYFGARYYSGDIGRFLSPDPHTLISQNINLANPQELNPYVYCINDPVNLFDANGFEYYVDECGYISHDIEIKDPNDPSVFLHTNGNNNKIGEIGGKIDADIIFSNLLEEHASVAQSLNALRDASTFEGFVKGGGIWDIKRNKETIYGIANDDQTVFIFYGEEMSSQDLGNFHYGVVGKAAGYLRWVLLYMAGRAQIGEKRSKKEWQTFPFNFRSPYGDDPGDQMWINMGINYYGLEYGGNQQGYYGSGMYHDKHGLFTADR